MRSRTSSSRHMHYDHVGRFHRFQKARFHLQEDRNALRDRPIHAPSSLAPLVRGRGRGRHRPAQLRASACVFYDGDAELAPGIPTCRCGGHSTGLQCVTVDTGARVGRARVRRHALLREHGGRAGPSPRPSTSATCSRATTPAAAGAEPAAHRPRPRPAGDAAMPAVPELEGVAVRLDVEPRARGAASYCWVPWPRPRP